MRQANRRSWRIGQTRPVKVVFMAYRGTLQADALKLVAQKLQSSLAVEGELPEDGLAAYGDDGDGIMLALARKIVNGDEEEEESVEEAFAQARDAEALSEELLVDEGWHAVEVDVEPEPVLVEVHRNGTGVPFEVADTNGHHDEAPETQQSLFSWAEFMAEEPEKPARRNGKPKPASLSLFEWAGPGSRRHAATGFGPKPGVAQPAEGGAGAEPRLPAPRKRPHRPVPTRQRGEASAGRHAAGSAPVVKTP